jgi:carbamoyl-phosphate synthase small subunit
MTAPHIGNTGVNDADGESRKWWLSGFVVRAASPRVSNYRADNSLDADLRAQGIVGITGIDTRTLVRHIRSAGALRGVISSSELDHAKLVAIAQAAPTMEGLDLVPNVTCAEAYTWTGGVGEWGLGSRGTKAGRQLHVVAYDFGIKHHILRLMAERGIKITVVPATTPASDVLAMHPDGVFLSNGPGDPAMVTYGIASTKELLGKVPLFGICLGHQILGLALGGTTYKLRFGHHGANQPVKAFGKVEISSHNHGFAVAADSLPVGSGVTHVNLNDQCVEGLEAPALKAFSVQYHPEAAPGPHDAAYLFDRFVQLMEG